MSDLYEFLKRGRELKGFNLASLPTAQKHDVMFRWDGWYFVSRHELINLPVWIGPYKLKEQAEQARDLEKAGL